jgi:hypothetical protein
MLIPKFEFDYVWNRQNGLGDCISIFTSNKPVWSPSPHYPILRKYSSLPSLDNPIGNGLNVSDLHEVEFIHPYAQHLFNRVKLVSGMEPEDKPKSKLDLLPYHPIKNNIAFSFDTSVAALEQHHMHPRARQLYPEHKNTIQAFINKHRDKYNFIQIGLNSFGFDNVTDKTNVPLEETISVLSTCQSYFGMHSGIKHLVAAFGIKSTIVINFPTIDYIKSEQPFEARNALQWEKQWLYPQNEILHEDEVGNEYEITIENLEAKVF